VSTLATSACAAGSKLAGTVSVAELATRTKVASAKLEVAAQRSSVVNVRAQVHTRVGEDPARRARFRSIANLLGLSNRTAGL
jgi:hypothetical protein